VIEKNVFVDGNSVCRFIHNPYTKEESRARSYGMATTRTVQRYDNFPNQQINQLQIWRSLESLTVRGRLAQIRVKITSETTGKGREQAGVLPFLADGGGSAADL
jgi:hypothetical protein